MNTATRTLIGFPPAIMVTLGLLGVMITLMGNRDVKREEIIKIKIPNIIMPVEEVVEVNPIEKPSRPVIDNTPPPTVTRQPFDNPLASHVITSDPAPKIEQKSKVKLGDGLSLADGEYLPIHKVAPIYPHRASSRGIEGDVLIEYTVTKNGSVKDPFVVKSASSLLERNALNSALKYKYKPRVINGKAVEVHGVRTAIKFRLDQ